MAPRSGPETMKMENKPEMTNEQRDEMLASRPHPSVTGDLIESKIKEIEYVIHGVHTICYLTLENGFIVTGQSACADPRNYNEVLGKKIAYDNAFREVWPLEGYLLKERLSSTPPMTLDGTEVQSQESQAA